MISSVKLRASASKHDHTQGPEDAPLVLVEYGDYECSFCKRADLIIKEIQKALGDDLRYVYRNYPLVLRHPHAMDAARAAESAALQDRFWEMHSMLFRNQENLEHEDLVQYAKNVGLDGVRFTRDLESVKVEEKIALDLDSGARSGVEGAPTFFINGFRYDGDWSYESLLTVLMNVRADLAEEKMKKAG